MSTDRLSKPRIGINDFLDQATEAFDDKVNIKIVGDQWYSISVIGWRELENGHESQFRLSRDSHGTQDIEQTLYELLEDWKKLCLAK